MLASLLLAIGIGIAGWSAFLALRRGPMRTAATAPGIDDLPRPHSPQRLPAGPDFTREAVAADAQRRALATVDVAIRVRHVPASLQSEGAGVALFMADTGADFVWIPLASATAAPDGSLIVTSRSHTNDKIIVTLATSRAFARHGYLARSIARVASEPGGAITEIALDVAVSTVRLVLPPMARRAGPLRLVRVDDPDWLPMHHSATGITLVGDSPQSLLLGAGQYELCDPLVPLRRQRFEAPASDPIVLIDSLAVLRAGRP